MARLPALGDAELPESFREPVRETEAAGGDGTVLRVLAHQPELFDRYFQFYYPSHDGGVVSPALKELARLRIAQHNDCFT